MSQTWILVGDGSHARLFGVDALDPTWKLLRTVGREHSHERTGRADSHEDRGEHDFARRLAAELETARQAGTFQRLVLVAPPKFLGQVRGALHASLAALVVKTVDHDYTHMSDKELSKHIDLA
ncbi:hypothetical protein BH11MYX3_BH11MYX3_48730 [soil metagenome]